MGKTAGVISINVNAGTAQLILDMEKGGAAVSKFGARAKSGMREFQSHTVTSMQASSAAIRALEGSMNIRAVEKFMTAILPLGPALQAAFPVVGAVAFLGVLAKVGTETYKFYRSIQDAPEKLKGAFRELNAPIRATNDELRVTNDRLANQIAKLEGKRQNTLKLALDEARLAADHLADSLDRDLKSLYKLLNEQNVSWWSRQFGGAGAGIAKEIGGQTGSGGFDNKINEITDDGNNKIRAAPNLKAKDAAQTALNTRLTEAYAAEIAKVNQQLDTTRQIITKGVATTVENGKTKYEFPTGGVNYPGIEERLKQTKRFLESRRDDIQDRATNVKLTDRRDALEAGRDNEKLQRPFENVIEKLKAEITAAKSRLEAAGLDEAAKLIAKAHGDAVLKIEEVIKANKRLHASMSDGQKRQIEGETLTRDTIVAQAEWKERVAFTSAQIKEQVLSQEMLTAAIGKGYEAVKKANVETKVIQEVKPERYGDSKWMRENSADVEKIRTAAGRAYDAGAIREGTSANDSLGDQIELEKKLAQAQIQGAEAVRLATLQFRLDKLEKDRLSESNNELNQQIRKQIQSELDLYKATRENEQAGELAKLQQRIDAIHRLTAAQYEGAEAVRKAALENKYAEMARSGDKPETIAAQRQDDEAAHQEQIAAEIGKRLNLYKDHLAQLDQEAQQLKTIKVTEENRVSIARAARDIENERLKVLVDQALAGRKMSDGVHAFFLEMQRDSVNTAEVIYSTLTKAVDGVSDNFAKFLTGQKTSFSQMFKGLGEEMLKSTIKSAAQKGLGALGKAFGVDIGGLAKPDGSTSDKALWVRMAGGSVGPQLVPPNARNVLFGNGGLLGTGSVPKIAGGGLGSMGGPDGSQESPFYVVIEPGRLGSGKPQTKPAGGSWWSTIIGAATGALGKIGGGGGGGNTPDVSSTITYGGEMGSGGLVRPDAAYLVGERGPEILTGASGRILNNTESRRVMGGGGPVNVYNIDNRGTDPVMAEQRTKAGIIAAHASAIGTSVQVNHDMARRVPSKVA